MSNSEPSENDGDFDFGHRYDELSPEEIGALVEEVIELRELHGKQAKRLAYMTDLLCGMGFTADELLAATS